MRNIIVLFITFFLYNILLAQSVENIEKTIKKAQNISYQNKDSALYFANLALSMAENIDSPRLIFNAQRAKGLIYEDYKEYAKAQEAYKIALDFANVHALNDEQFTILTDWAIIHKKMGQYAIAQEYHQLVIEKAKQTNNWERIEEGYHGLGTMYSMLSDFNKSIACYLKSIEAAEKWGNLKGIVLTEQNISNIYLKAKNYPMALSNIEKTYKMAQKLGDSSRLAAVLKIYGKINIAMGNYSDALEKNLLVKNLFDKRGDKPRLAETYLSLGDLFYNQKNYTQAEAYFDTCAMLQSFLPQYSFAEFHQKQGKLYQAQNKPSIAVKSYIKSLKITDSLGFKEIAKENHLALSTLFSSQKQFEKAFYHNQKALLLGETLAEEANQKNMTDAQFRFEVEKRDFKIDTQKNQLQQSSLIRWILICGLILSAFFIGFIWKQMREKQKANEHTKLIMRELHHRVKNNMQTIASMMRLQARQSTDPSVASVLLENRSRLETFSMLHQQLYQNDNIETLNLKPFIESMFEKLRFLFNLNENCKLKLHLNIENKNLDVETALSIGLILNELMTNSMKYAAPSVLPLEISISIQNHRFLYADNGKILSPNFDFDKYAGFGTHLITYFSQQIKGKYRFFIDNGFHFELIFA